MPRTLAVALLSLLAAAGPARPAPLVSGAGATAPAPLYAKWAEVYRSETGVRINYQSIGSGAGVKQITARTVAFGATDKPIKPELRGQLLQFPTVVLGAVPVVNLPGLQPGRLRLTGEALADIYLGRIRRWADPRIGALNPGLHLPNLPITVVHRSDGAGTTFLFTSYLAAKSPEWLKRVGASDAVAWPAGQGGKGNDGVAAFVRQTPGAIGYVEFAFARVVKLAHVSLQNRDGRFVQPDARTFAAAAYGADWAHAAGFAPSLVDRPGPESWPLTSATFVLLQRRQDDPGAAQATLRFFDWAYARGDGLAAGLDFVPVPPAVESAVRTAWAREVIDRAGRPVFGAGR